MKSNRPWFSLVLLCFLALPLAAQVNDTYVIPVVGDASGAAGTRWATEFHVFNPQAYTLTVTAVFLPTGGAVGEEVSFDVGSNQTAFAENVVRDVFERTGVTGSLLVATFPEENPGVPDSILARSFLVNTKTFNNASSGTFGQSVPGVWAGLQDVDSDGITAIANGVRDFGILGQTGYRTNIGAVNLGRFSVIMRVSVYDAEGDVVADRLPFTVPPLGHIQDRLPANVDHGSVEFWIEDPQLDAVVFPYASVVDNRSGDGSYINPVLLASPGIIFPKIAATTEVGTKINTDIARRVRATAISLGKIAPQSSGKISR